MAEQKIAFVTGANKGIGFETSRELAKLGFKVFMGARDEGRGTAAEQNLHVEGHDVEFVHLDVAKSEHINRVAKMMKSNYGHLDVLINNAGIAHADEPLFSNSSATVTREVLQQTFDVNFFGLVELTLALLPLLKNSKAGRIVNMSSMLGSMGLHTNPEAGLDQIKPLAYDASKAAVNMFTIHLAALLKDTSVKVNSAHPGWVKTDMGGEQAPMEIVEGIKTGLALATLDDDGPTGGFFHMGEAMPW